MGLGTCLRSCPPIQATPESPPLLRYNRYPTPSLSELEGVFVRPWFRKQVEPVLGNFLVLDGLI